MSPGNSVKRMSLAFAVALLAAVCVAAPVLAEETPFSAMPNEGLETPQTEAERDDSEFAYADLSPGEEEQLLREQFAPQLKSIDADPARLLEDVELNRIDSPTEALVTLDGEKMLLEAEVPLRAPEEDGALHKVELELEETAGGYEPANPLVDLGLPASGDDPIEIGDEGLSVLAVGASDSSASLLGDTDLFLPAVYEDTSLVLSPVAKGVEISALLASRNSPEWLSFEMTLPEDASLRTDSSGGAEVIDSDGSVLATVGTPHAVDAQGTEVPTTLRTEGHLLVLEVSHREMDVAYPLFVDPPITENWSNFADTSKLSYWKWSWSGVGSEDFIGRTSCIVTCWGNGLYVRSRSNFSYPKGSWGRWWFVPQGSTTYMSRVVIGPMNYDAHGCTANEPHPYVGVWNDSSGWKVLSNAYPAGWGTSIDTGTQNLGPGTRTAFVGIEAATAANISCGHDYRLGGATLYLSDPERPTVGAPSGYPSGWIKKGDTFTVSGQASDPGLGVKKATLRLGGTVTLEKQHSCDGHYSNPCPGNYTFQFPLGAESLDEGERTLNFTAWDAIDNYSDTSEAKTKVDRTPPEVALAGLLAEATDETEGDAKDDKDKPLTMPVYNLTIDATDGRVGTTANPVQAAEKRSGVKKIEVFLDQNATPLQTWETSSCAAGNCPMSKVFTLKLNELSADTDHYLRILARDFAGNAPRERKLEFEYIPATGMKDEYVMQYFPLPDGTGDEDEEEHPSRPELAVNLVSGNLVYRQSDLEVPGAGADLELDLYYNSLLPESQNTEWGDGWTLAQTPELEPEAPAAPGPPTEATIVEENGGVESKVDLPEAVGEEDFDKRLQATITKEPGGGYELSDESGETDAAVAFDSTGRPEELRNGTAATVDYQYEAGGLAAISVEDPATAKVDPEAIEEKRVWPDLVVHHSTNFGALGSADGQLKEPADVVTDSQGNLWVVDRGNSRIEKFSPSGQFLAKFGSFGSGDGQLKEPTALTFDAAGNIWVADWGNSRVQKFSPGGQFISKFGVPGFNNGQFVGPNGIVIDSKGAVWVIDGLKVQKFTASGTFVKRIGTIASPESIATDGRGSFFVADGGSGDRIVVYDEEGNQLRTIGSPGTGPGQFTHPAEVAVDPEGNVWVGDDKAANVQLFNSAGDYITKFGAPGSGPGQFTLNPWMGIAPESNGRIWVSDGGNSRVGQWLLGHYTPSSAPGISHDDPQLDVDLSEGLVDTIEGEESGTIDYTHSGDLLTAVDRPDGKATYAYDGAGRMTKVTLRNGTYASIAYEPSYGRVSSVTVAPSGANPKTTYFAYSTEPRRTVVTPPDAPATTYDIAADGSIFKWWNTKAPPIFDSIGGTLYDPNNRETSQPISVGTHTLLVQAHSDQGLASIQIVANNNQLVDEKICLYPSEPTKCQTMVNEWVTETGGWPPGILYLEVIATDRFGEAVSQRFWVNIPYTPPPDPEAEKPPKFNDVLRFREEFGLDLDLGGDEIAINDRIFDSIGAWHEPSTPAGEVARATAAKWGVPLRSADAAELGYRESYIEQAAEVIPTWAASHSPGTYAGYYVNHRQGGVIHIGFTSNQANLVSELKAQAGLIDPKRVSTFENAPTAPLAALGSLAVQIPQQIAANPSISNLTTKVALSTTENRVEVGATDLQSVTNFLNSRFGQSAPFTVELDAHKPVTRERLRPDDSRLFAGDLINGAEGNESWDCTLGFGALERKETKPNEAPVYLRFGLTAGHCWVKDTPVYRVPSDTEHYRRIGAVTRRTYEAYESGLESDGEAVLLKDGVGLPRWVYWSGAAQYQISGSEKSIPGSLLCTSGSYGGSDCGYASEPFVSFPGGKPPVWVVQSSAITTEGDSGGPVWNMETGKAVGLVEGGYESTGPTWFTPLESVSLPDGQEPPGLLTQLDAKGGGPLHVSR